MNDPNARIEEIVTRNIRVERDKAWETSLTRRGFIAIITYSVAAYYLWLIGVNDFLLHALVPTGGYIFSTLSLPWMKKLWLTLKK